jgi:hypothetical protein
VRYNADGPVSRKEFVDQSRSQFAAQASKGVSLNSRLTEAWDRTHTKPLKGELYSSNGHDPESARRRKPANNLKPKKGEPTYAKRN